MIDIHTMAAAVVILGAVISLIKYLWHRFGEQAEDYYRRARLRIIPDQDNITPRPIKIRNSGVLMGGKCAVRTEVCLSPNGEAPVTAVHTSTEGQINVCSACLDAQLVSKRWDEVDI